MALTVDLNADMGESFGVYTLGDDDAMLDIVTTANVACGFHAGDPLVMHRTVERAKARGVAIGAHPGFLDLWGFGRRRIEGDPPEDVARMVVYQIGALQAIAAAAGHRVTHVKPHGALANRAVVDDTLAEAIAQSIRRVDPGLIFMVMPGMATERAGEKAGLRLVREVYADRTYDDDGSLTARKEPGAVIHDTGLAAARVLRMLEEQAITTISGAKLPARIDTICVHGDNPAAVAMARALRRS
ncbi:MAG TPA: 5-oxoprolinase subunit PxpA, partial [Azospirillaceae bacterium]|nr:5-oxoprolinase subunit PxpA [Azospirillaceae bacterium]